MRRAWAHLDAQGNETLAGAHGRSKQTETRFRLVIVAAQLPCHSVEDVSSFKPCGEKAANNIIRAPPSYA